MLEFTSDLPQQIAGPYAISRPLPPYRGILAVDAKDFTGRPAIEHGAVSRVVPELLRTALIRAELRDLWDERMFAASTGDGYVFGFDPVRAPFVIHPGLHAGGGTDRLQHPVAWDGSHQAPTQPAYRSAARHGRRIQWQWDGAQ